MSYFSETWKARASARWGEAPHIRLSVRTCEDTPQTVVLTDTEEVVSMNPISRKRERKFGVIQGQAWQLQLTNDTLAALSLALEGGWAQAEVGFPTADVWAVVAPPSRIQNVTVTTESLVTLEMGNILVDLMEARTTRDIYFRNTAWAGEIHDMSRSETSKGYDNEASGAGVVPYGSWTNLILDETFIIEFTSPTAFKVILEDGTETQTGTITADLNVFGTSVPVAGFERLTINWEGWDQNANAYTTGDRFVFYTSKARTNAELGGMALVNDLLGNVAELRYFNFTTGVLTDFKYQPQAWFDAIAATAADKFGGFWPRGSKVVDMVQGIMVVLHASIFPMPNGTLHFWMLEPGTEIGVTLNGDPDYGPVSIMEGTHGRGLGETYNHVIYRYKNLVDGSDATAIETDPDTPFEADLVLDVDVKWEVRALSVETAVSRALQRFKAPTKTYQVETTFDGAIAEIGELALLNEPALGVAQKQVSVVAVDIDPLADKAVVTTAVEEILLDDYAVVGDVATDPVGSQVGASGDTGAGKVW